MKLLMNESFWVVVGIVLVVLWMVTGDSSRKLGPGEVEALVAHWLYVAQVVFAVYFGACLLFIIAIGMRNRLRGY